MAKFEMRSRDFSEFAVGTLASLTAGLISTKIDSSRLQGCIPRKMRWNADWLGKTQGVAEGPLAFGLSTGMTGTQIASAYSADPQSTFDTAEIEESQPRMLELGRIGQSQISALENPMIGLRTVKWPGWRVIEGITLSHYIFNANPGDPFSTGMTFQLYTETFGEWLDD